MRLLIISVCPMRNMTNEITDNFSLTNEKDMTNEIVDHFSLSYEKL